MDIIITLLLVLFISFTNMWVWAEVKHEVKAHHSSFKKEWNQIVYDSQDTTWGRALMRAYYFVPSVYAIFTK